ncbi:Bifunctional protein HldE [Pseudoclavibacter triregionum]|nr:Bifunctional protein HldE [Pseudoclavibacter triregionum]
MPHEDVAAPEPLDPIAVLGDALVEELRPRKAPARERPGGGALRVAIDLARLGDPCVLIAPLGKDDDGKALRRALRDAGVPLLPSVDAERGTGRVVLAEKKKRIDVEFSEAARGRRVRFDEVQQAAIARAPLVVVAGFPFDDRRQHRRLLEHLASPQLRLVLDANPRSGLVEDAAAYRANFERHASSALLVHLSSRDAELLFAAPLDEVTSHLLDLGAAHVLATEGEAGSRWVTREGIDVHVPIATGEGPIASPSGAGDLVTAVAASELARFGPPIDDAEARAILERAMALAAKAIRGESGVLEPGMLEGLR